MSNIALERELKQKKTQLEKVKAEISAKQNDTKELNKQVSNIQKEINNLKDKQTGLEKDIKDMMNCKQELIVTEHAILRYLERSLCINIEEIKARIASESVKNQFAVLGNGQYPIDNGLKVVIKGNTIVTVIGEGEE